MTRCNTIVLAVATAVAILGGCAQAPEATHPAPAGFSFDVYGDSRSMMRS
jgi:hypothetical protein